MRNIAFFCVIFFSFSAFSMSDNKSVPITVKSIEKNIAYGSNSNEFLEEHKRKQRELQAEKERKEALKKARAEEEARLENERLEAERLKAEEAQRQSELENTPPKPTVFSFRKGLFIKDNLTPFLIQAGYKKFVPLNFPKDCDLQVVSEYDIPYEAEKAESVLANMLEKKRFRDVIFHKWDGTVTAIYTGSATLIEACLTRNRGY